MTTVLLTLATIALVIFLAVVFLHYSFKAPRLQLEQKPTDFGMPFSSYKVETVEKKNLQVWWIPADKSTRTIALLHGWGSSAAQLLPLARLFHLADYNVLMLDARNHGHSDSHGFSSMPRFAEDLHHSISWLRAHHPQAVQQLVLLGHSVGAAASLLEASRNHEYTGVISLAAFSHPKEVMRRWLHRWHLPDFIIRSILTYVQWIIGFRFDDIAPVSTVTKVQCPVLLVHGDADTTVPPEQAERIFAAADRNRCELELIPDARHDSVEKVEEHGELLVLFTNRVCDQS